MDNLLHSIAMNVERGRFAKRIADMQKSESNEQNPYIPTKDIGNSGPYLVLPKFLVFVFLIGSIGIAIAVCALAFRSLNPFSD